MSSAFGRTAALIDLAALEYNVRNIRALVPREKLLTAVVKANAYGHDIALTYPVFKACGVDRYAVAMWTEGAHLRKIGVTEPILILGDTMDEEMEKTLEYDLIPTVFTMQQAYRLEEILTRKGMEGRKKIHIKLDTGMGRIGFSCTEESVEKILAIGSLPHLEIEGIFSHFAKADEKDLTHAKGQYEAFERMLRKLEQRGLTIPLRHIDNSAAIMALPHSTMTMVRAGIILYGLYPSEDVDHDILKLKPVLSWRSHVSFVKTVDAGTMISYGGTFTAQRPSRIATIPVGYADGYSRGLSNCGAVLIRGQEAPVVGRVCMDQFMVDVTDIPEVARGDEVILLGGSVSAERMASLLHTINYEIVCDISIRVPRVVL